MGSVHEKVNPGERWRPRAKTLNTLADVAEEFEARTRGQQTTAAGVNDISILNMSGDVLPQFAIVGRGDPLITPAVNENNWRITRGFESTEPAEGDRFAILQTPVEVGGTAPAVIDGLTQALVYFAAAAHLDEHNFAGPADGEYASLTSQRALGPARIDWINVPVDTQLDGAINDAVTTIVVDDVDDWPDPAVEGEFMIQIGDEILAVTAVEDRTTWTVERGQSSTTAAAHADNDDVTFVSGTLWCVVRLGFLSDMPDADADEDAALTHLVDTLITPEPVRGVVSTAEQSFLGTKYFYVSTDFADNAAANAGLLVVSPGPYARVARAMDTFGVSAIREIPRLPADDDPYVQESHRTTVTPFGFEFSVLGDVGNVGLGYPGIDHRASLRATVGPNGSTYLLLVATHPLTGGAPIGGFAVWGADLGGYHWGATGTDPNGTEFHGGVCTKIGGAGATGSTGAPPTGAAVVLNPSAQWLAINAPSIDITGEGIDDGTPADNTITFDTLGADADVETSTPAPTTTTATFNFTTPPTSTGPLYATLHVDGDDSLSVIVANIVPAPTITATTTAISATTPYITITGTGFDPNAAGNTVTFTTLSATGLVVYVEPDGTSMTVQLTTPPNATGALNAKVNSYGGDSNTAQVANVATTTTNGPEVTPSTTPITTVTTTLTIYGMYFDPVEANNTVSLSSGTATVTTAETFSLLITFTSPPDPGPLYVVVTTNSVTSGDPEQVATVAAAPVIAPSTAKLATNAPQLLIQGTGLNGSSISIALSSGTATLAVVNASYALVTFTSEPDPGPLDAIVTIDGVDSVEEQIAEVVEIVVTPSLAPVSTGIKALQIFGENFGPHLTAVSVVTNYSPGPTPVNPIWLAADEGSLNYKFTTTAGTPGTVTAVVHAYGGHSGTAVPVATVTAGSTVWHDTFTDTNGTLLDAHTPDVGTGGYDSSEFSDVLEIQSNKARCTSYTGGGNARSVFDPGLPSSAGQVIMTIDIEFLGVANETIILWCRYQGGGTGISVSITKTSISAPGGGDTLTLSDNVVYTATIVNDANEVRVTVDGVEIQAFSGTTGNTETQWAIQLFNSDSNPNGSQLDNLTVTG